jgi:hypothetical protein
MFTRLSSILFSHPCNHQPDVVMNYTSKVDDSLSAWTPPKMNIADYIYSLLLSTGLPILCAWAISSVV